MSRGSAWRSRANTEDARRLTVKRNAVAVVTDGSAVLGLGNLGPEAALPVMEGKAALFKRFAGIDAWPICLDTQDVDEIVRTVQLIAPVFAGINLEDISAPRCFEIEARLRELLDIPVFHDDQHGTAIVVLAALTNALRVVGKKLDDVRIVMSGAGAAGSAIVRLLIEAGAKDVVVADVDGVIHQARRPEPLAAWIADNTNADCRSKAPSRRPCVARTSSSASRPRTCSTATTSRRWPTTPSSSRWPTPTPRSTPPKPGRHAAVVATGRSDYPNQINNVLAFPGVFRGLLDASATAIDDPLLVAAAKAIAWSVSDDELNANYVIPSVFHEEVHKAVAAAVKDAAQAAGS